MDDCTQVAAANDYPIELWRDETARDLAVWPSLRDACAGIAAHGGRKIVIGDPQHPEDRYYEYARDVDTGEGHMLVPCGEGEADAVRCRLICWTVPQ